jgi:chloramphenicol O-acetyltransferase type B
MLRRLTWAIFTRNLYKFKYEGFSASLLSYSEGNVFSSFNRLSGSSMLFNSEVGKHTYFAGSVVRNCKIGSFCSFGYGALVGGLGVHPTNLLSTHPIFYSTLQQSGKSFAKRSSIDESPRTTIGNDVWIGVNAIVMDGVSIGNGAIVGAGAIVTKDVPSYAIVVGAPAKIMKYRFSESEISLLNQLEWWNLSDDVLENNLENFNLKDIYQLAGK